MFRLIMYVLEALLRVLLTIILFPIVILTFFFPWIVAKSVFAMIWGGYMLKHGWDKTKEDIECDKANHVTRKHKFYREHEITYTEDGVTYYGGRRY